jgi:hypothetical protein
MRKLAFLPLAAFLACLTMAGPVPASAQSGTFLVSQHGQQVGTASFNFYAIPSGYDSTALVRISMKGLDYAISKTERLSKKNRLRYVALNATINGSAVTVTATPDQTQIILNMSANGHTSTTQLDKYPAAVFLTDFDPGALETLLTLGAARNNSDLWAVIPKREGTIVPVQLVTDADESGTLDGKPIVVHHLVATISGAVTELFSDANNQLLQAELPQQGFALVRNGFVLTPPARPGTPPAR